MDCLYENCTEKQQKKYKKTSQGEREREYTPYLNSLRKVEMRTAPEKYGKFSAQLFYCTGFVVPYRSSSEIYTYCKCIQPLLINKFSYYHGTREVGVNHYTFCLCARLSYRTGFHFSAIFFFGVHATLATCMHNAAIKLLHRLILHGIVARCEFPFFKHRLTLSQALLLLLCL